ncbi:reverse transcriptase [Corchorus capsularis]|uniref:Reverse transcriptase n=1 Tax=Corchorus capsularis TaxID=210143 RepID=A0A1R3IDY9_COCAP|nr:reverse transcriptase [Corchorus capsularis]
MSCIYGHPELQKRQDVWNQVIQFSTSIPENENWLILGDFNQVLSSSDKLSNTSHSLQGAESLRECLDICNPSEVAAKGQHFTWTSNREEEIITWERLDRAFANPAWFRSFSDAVLTNLPLTVSDHGLMILQLEKSEHFRRRPYRFEWMWTTHPGCKEEIKKAWNQQHQGSAAYQLVQKLKCSRDGLRRWNKNTFGNLRFRRRKMEERLAALQGDLMNMESRNEEKVLRNELEMIMEQEQMHWMQKSRENWIIHSDRNTKYYHTLTKKRRMRNRILSIKNGRGETLEDIKEIEDEFLKEYGKCYEEVRQAAFQLGPMKAPGVDGKPATFYQQYWDVVGNLTTQSAFDFLNNGHILKELNKTLIALIPKKKDPSVVNDYRPISLCNVAYKIISRVLVNRMKEVLNEVISPFQSAFIKGRAISDNVIIAGEIIETIRKRENGKGILGALKLDMNKAYDRVSWLFLETVMESMGFNGHWIQVIKEKVRDLIQNFCYLLGQKVNYSKSDLMVSPNYPQRHKRWFKGILKVNLTQNPEPQEKEKLKENETSCFGGEDKLVWKAEPNGQFSVKAAYKMVSGNHGNEHTTRDEVWFASTLTLRVENFININWIEWIATWLDKNGAQDDEMQWFTNELVLNLWYIWVQRNEVIFQGLNPNPIAVIHKVKHTSSWIQSAYKNNQETNERMKRNKLEIRVPIVINGGYPLLPTNGWIVWVDLRKRQGANWFGASMLARDSQGNTILLSKSIQAKEAWLARLKLARLAYQRLRECGAEEVHFQNGDKRWINALIARTCVTWQKQLLLEDIKKLSKEFKLIAFCRGRHPLAKEARKMAEQAARAWISYSWP